MSAEQALFDAYREWHRLARAGHKAIDRRDWNFLIECQKLVKKIQPCISNLSREARNEWKRLKADRGAREKELNSLVSNLTAQLESNQKLLRSVRETVSSEHASRRAALEKAGQNLKRIQSSYAITRPSAWTSFS